jgi:putative endonuclease
MFYTYILYSKKDGDLYHGHSSNLKERFIEHQKGRVPATKNRRPLILIYYEAFLAEKEAYYKTGPGRKFIKRHLKNTLENFENK